MSTNFIAADFGYQSLSCNKGLVAAILFVAFLASSVAEADRPTSGMTLSWKDNYLTIHGDQLPGGNLRVHYLEAYCRDGSTDRNWDETVIAHRTELIAGAPDGKVLELQCTLNDGVVVDHQITTRQIDNRTDAVDFRLVASNPTCEESRAHWAQPCIRVGDFTGHSQENYLLFCVRQWPFNPPSDATLGRQGSLRARPGLLSGTCRSQRSQSSATQLAGPVQRLDRLLF